MTIDEGLRLLRGKLRRRRELNNHTKRGVSSSISLTFKDADALVDLLRSLPAIVKPVDEHPEIGSATDSSSLALRGQGSSE